MGYLLITSDSHLRTRINKLLPAPCKTISRIADICSPRLLLSHLDTCIIVDDKIADTTQAELLYLLAEKQVSQPIIQLFHASGRIKTQKPVSYGNITLIAKPFTDTEFQNVLHCFNSMTTQTSQNIVGETPPDYQLRTIIGSSPQMCALRKTILQIGQEQCTVHISGETGSGKELVAKAIYEAGILTGAFVSENCSLLEGSLVEATLFGYRKGAFTDAYENRTGLVSAAQGGLLFLDEIENLHLTTQAKLLRLLETGEFRPIGSSRNQKASFRLVTAANEPLKDLVRDNRLRKDFLYRIARFPICIPPLREHMEDIPELVDHYFRMNGERRTLSAEGLSLLLNHDWPGNVRQLFSVLCRGRIRCGKEKPIITLCDEDFNFGL